MLCFNERLTEYLNFVENNILQNNDISHIGKYGNSELLKSIKRLRINNKKFMVTVQTINVGIDKNEP